jgi:hypothetical protein
MRIGIDKPAVSLLYYICRIVDPLVYITPDTHSQISLQRKVGKRKDTAVPA